MEGEERRLPESFGSDGRSLIRAALSGKVSPAKAAPCLPNTDALRGHIIDRHQACRQGYGIGRIGRQLNYRGRSRDEGGWRAECFLVRLADLLKCLVQSLVHFYRQIR